MSKYKGLWSVDTPQYEGAGLLIWIKNHSLLIFLAGLTFVQMIIAGVAFWLVWRHGWESFQAGKTPGFWVFAVYYVGHLKMSMLADSFGAWLQVWATKHFTDKEKNI